MGDTLIANAVKGWRFLYRRGFREGFGHLSARLPDSDRFILARHSLGLAATPEDFLALILDGRKLEGKGDAPGEYPIHLEILRARPDARSVIHYHGMHSTAFTSTSEKSACGRFTSWGTLFHDGIPVSQDPRLVNDKTRGLALAKALGPHRAVLMRAHGAAITGASVEEAVGGAFLFEENARRACISEAACRWLEEEMAAAVGQELLANRGPFRRVWAMVEAEDEQ